MKTFNQQARLESFQRIFASNSQAAYCMSVYVFHHFHQYFSDITVTANLCVSWLHQAKARVLKCLTKGQF